MIERSRIRPALSFTRTGRRSRRRVVASAIAGIVLSVQAVHADQFAVTKSPDSPFDSRGLVLDGTVAQYGIGVNGNSFTSSAITTVNGWQYAAYWVRAGTSAASNYAAVARRPVGTTAWQVANLTNSLFANGLNGTRPSDAHNVVSLGIDETDGSIHLAYDHHNNNLKYRVSDPGLTTNPNAITSAQWSQSLFNAERNWLTGSVATPGPTVADVTYPHFVTANDGKLQLTYRTGSSGNGSNWLTDYNATTKTWAAPTQYDDGRVGTYTGTVTAADPNRNSYINGLTYGKGGRLYQSFTWREGATGAANHDIAFVYSDDKGQTWKNNAGTTVGNAATGQKWNVFTPGLTVVPLDEGQSLMNQQAQAVSGQTTADEKFHTLMWHRDTARSNTGGVYAPTESSYFHYWRDDDGNFHRNKLPGAVGSRPKLFFDADDNAFAVYQTGTFSSAGIYINRGSLVIAAATRGTNWNDWKIIKTEAGPFVSEAQADARLLALNGTLSVLMQNSLLSGTAAGATGMRALDYTFAITPSVNRAAVADGEWSTAFGSTTGVNDNAIIGNNRSVTLQTLADADNVIVESSGYLGLGSSTLRAANSIVVGRNGSGYLYQVSSAGQISARRMVVGDYVSANAVGGTGSARITGSLTVDELQIAMGQGTANSSLSAEGSSRVTVNGEVLLGDLGNAARLSVSGGVMTVAGDIREGLSGASGSQVNVSGTGTLDMTGNAIRADTLNFLSGGVVQNVRAINSIGGIGGGTIQAGGPLSVNDGDFNGSLQNYSTPTSLTKLTARTLTLSGNNTYTGVTTIAEGVLRAASNNALGTTAGNTVIPGGTGTARLELSGGRTIAEPLSLGGRQPNVATSDAPHVLNISGTNTLTGSFATNVGGNQYNVSSDGGKLIVAGSFVNNGTGGATDVRTLNLGGSAEGEWQSVIANNANGTAVTAVTKRGVGTWSLTAANTYTGPTTVAAGTLRANAAATNTLLTGVGGVDLAAGATLQLDYAATSPAATVRAILDAGEANGFASGRLRSSALPAGRTIGYADDEAGRVVVRVTLPGDGDLDGDVDFNDFVRLQTQFGSADARFDQGDFDFDGVVTFDDFVMLQTNFGDSLAGRDVSVTATERSAVRAFGIAHAVPEPAAIGTLAVLSSLAGRRRRR